MKRSEETAACVLMIIGGSLLGILAPVLSFALSYFIGWLLKITIGTTVVSGLNLVFDTERFSVNNLPLVCATLSLVGSYFRSTLGNKKDKNEK